MITLEPSPAVEVLDRIIRSQERVVGKAAWKLAKRVRGLDVARDHAISIAEGADHADVVERLVREYAQITGELGARMCFMSAADILRDNPGLDVPSFRPYTRFA